MWVDYTENDGCPSRKQSPVPLYLNGLDRGNTPSSTQIKYSTCCVEHNSQWQHTVPSESIQTRWLIPHVVTLQPYVPTSLLVLQNKRTHTSYSMIKPTLLTRVDVLILQPACPGRVWCGWTKSTCERWRTSGLSCAFLLRVGFRLAPGLIGGVLQRWLSI
jgi:hypothetical protein